MEANLEQYSEPCGTFKIKVLAKIVATFSFWLFRKKLYITFFKILNSNLLPVTTWGKSSIHMWRGFWIRLCSNWLFSIRFILDICQSSECVSAIYTTTIIKRLPVRSIVSAMHRIILFAAKSTSKSTLCSTYLLNNKIIIRVS